MKSTLAMLVGLSSKQCYFSGLCLFIFDATRLYFIFFFAHPSLEIFSTSYLMRSHLAFKNSLWTLPPSFLPPRGAQRVHSLPACPPTRQEPCSYKRWPAAPASLARRPGSSTKRRSVHSVFSQTTDSPAAPTRPTHTHVEPDMCCVTLFPGDVFCTVLQQLPNAP